MECSLYFCQAKCRTVPLVLFRISHVRQHLLSDYDGLDFGRIAAVFYGTFRFLFIFVYASKYG